MKVFLFVFLYVTLILTEQQCTQGACCNIVKGTFKYVSYVCFGFTVICLFIPLYFSLSALVLLFYFLICFYVFLFLICASLGLKVQNALNRIMNAMLLSVPALVSVLTAQELMLYAFYC